MTKRMQRTPTEEEVNAKVAELPGGELVPERTARQVLDVFDANGDGVLQRDEWRQTDQIRASLEKIFMEEKQANAAEQVRLRKLEEKNRKNEAMREQARQMGLFIPDDFNDGPPTILDRTLYSALPYLLPLADSTFFSGHLFQTHPELQGVLAPLASLSLVYRAIPFSAIGAFFAFQFAANRPTVNKLVRYNLRQAVNLSIMASICGIFIGGLGTAGDEAAGTASDVIFLSFVAMCLYSVVSSVFGRLPTDIPIVSAMNRENPNNAMFPGYGEGEESEDKSSDDDKRGKD